MIISSSSRFSSICFSVHSLIVSHMMMMIFIWFVFLSDLFYFVLFLDTCFIYGTCFYVRYAVFIFCTRLVSLVAVVALLSADWQKTYAFLFFTW